jgi:hypothetical protein
MKTISKYDAWLLFTKSAAKEERIKKSQCLTYKLAGGGFTRENDLKQAEKVSERIYNYWQNKK